MTPRSRTVTMLGVVRPVNARLPGTPNAATRRESPDDWHWKARRVLARFGARTVPALVEALSVGDDPAVRQFAAESLGRLGHEARSAWDALGHAAHHDESPGVRAAAVAAQEVMREAVERPGAG